MCRGGGGSGREGEAHKVYMRLQHPKPKEKWGPCTGHMQSCHALENQSSRQRRGHLASYDPYHVNVRLYKYIYAYIYMYHTLTCRSLLFQNNTFKASKECFLVFSMVHYHFYSVLLGHSLLSSRF